KGLAGISVQGGPVAARRPSPSIPPAETDAEGRYHVRVARGKVQITASYPWFYSSGSFSGPAGARQPDREYSQRDVTADTTWPDLKLSRPAAIDGVVVDGRGQPVPRAEVLVDLIRENGFAGFASRPPLRTGRDGRFRLDWFHPDDRLEVRARTGEAMTDGAIQLRARDQKGQLTLTVDPGATFRVRGAVADKSDRPIEGAEVLLYQRHWYPGRRGGRGWLSEKFPTDASGRFVSGPLWPGDEYQLVVSAKGYTRFESPFMNGQK